MFYTLRIIYLFFSDFVAGNCIYEDTPALNALNDTLRKHRLTIVAWVHSHVGKTGYECELSNIDIHTQKNWSNIYPDILSLVVHVGDDRCIMSYDFYAITKEGYDTLNKCDKPYYCRCHWDGHRDPQKKLTYTSCLEYVKFTEDNLKILEIKVDDPMVEEPISKKPKLISTKYASINNKPISSIDFSCQHRILSTQISVKVLKKISPDSYLIGDSTETCKLKLASNLTLLEEGKSYKIMFKDTIFEDKCIIVTDETDMSEFFGFHVTVPYEVAMKIDKKVITPKVRTY